AHEYTHGLSGRLVDNLSYTQGGGINEGTSDFMALCLTSKPTDDPNGKYTMGQWLFNNNGIRRQPYCLDQNTFTRKFVDLENSIEVHDAGEIWCETLWLLRGSLIAKYGPEPGNKLAEQMLVDAEKFMPSDPDFLDGRDAFLASDAGVNNSEN